MAKFTIPAQSGDPFYLSTCVDGGAVEERERTSGKDAAGRPKTTIDLDDSTQLGLTLVRHDLVEVDAGNRVAGEDCTYTNPPFHLDLWQPGLCPPPTPEKNHALPGATYQPPKKKG